MFERAYRAAMRQAWRRGVGDGSRIWLGLGAAALGLRLAQRLGTPVPRVAREDLRPGQTLVITNLPKPS